MRLIVTDRVVWSVGLSVTLVSPAKTAAQIAIPFGWRTRVGPKNRVLDGGPDPPMGRGNFEGRKGCPIIKYRDSLWSSVQKQVKRSRCHLGRWIGWAIGIVLDGVQRCWGILPWQPILGLKLLLTGFVWMIATRQLVMEWGGRGWVVGWQNADIADTLHLRDVAMVTIFWLSTLCLKNVPTYTTCYIFLRTQFDCDNFWHKCCQESRQSKCTLFSHHT